MGFFNFKGKKDKQENLVKQDDTLNNDVNFASNNNSSFLNKIKKGLGRTSAKLNDGFRDIFIRKRLDDQTLSDLEDLLITADFGIDTANMLCSLIKKEKYEKDITVDEVKKIISNKIEEILTPFAKKIEINPEHKPQILLFCGVNGTGKTTTIGKIASGYANQGKKVFIAACDTFRAAAVKKIAVRAKRSNV